ncbi:MAG: hypothetical protein JWL61_1087 [Gemmatimonadetes bacterium]|nr:hypothetical protein [Gemmatimonadota bacterium]
MADLQTAERQAQQLLDRFSITKAPVPVEDLAKSLGVEVRYQSLEPNVSGVLVRRGNKVVIGVNSNHHSNRQRFTIAHELGHYLLHPDSPTVFVDGALVHFRGEDLTGPSDLRELEANAFAGALLLPEATLRLDLRGQYIDAFDEVAVRGLSNRYQVSQQALTIRLMRLGLAGGMR